ncbi:GNAT family N-acetyltransferase [Microvirga aerilata]|uniref:GNAT family N-acetyltransferase n=1 Tax=Microvirga aerilata TaxID=670292 RepID=A0A937D1K5_9HYPH|nr:GNAT family N-acetyltransferase [Microvirga aerilata]MBL0404235.1 GNAT family N-acetyltransferase [Microvirga aerilata]
MSPSHPPALDALGHRLSIADAMDATAILSLARAFHAEDGHPLSYQGERALGHLFADQTHGLVFKIESTSDVIGYAVLCFGYSVELGGRDVFLDDFYIIPSERGHGLGRSVMNALISFARDAGCAAMHLEVVAGNRAEVLYRRLGFQDRGSAFLTLRI